MTEDVLFLLLLVGLYAWECLNWLTPGSVVFRGGTEGQARWWVPPLAFENRLGVPVGGRPWPPFTALFGFAPWPFAVTAEGLATHTASSWIRDTRPRRPLTCWRWEEIEEIEIVGRDLVIDGEKILRCPSSRMLRRVFELLGDLLELDREDRTARIRSELEDWLDPTAVRRRMEAGSAARRGVWVLTQALFLHLVVIVPFVVMTQGLSWTWLVLGGAALALNLTVTVLFVAAHRAQQPEQPGERWTTALVMSVFFPLTARAHDHLTRDLLGDLHPWAARELLSESEQTSLGLMLARDLRWPLPEFEELSEETARILAGFHMELESRIAPLLPEIPPGDPDGSTACPRCEEVFDATPVICPDCGVRLAPAS